MAPTFQVFTSTQANSKVWNATTGGIPTNWEQPAFDDSAWPTPFVTPDFSVGSGPPSGITALAPWAHALTTTDTMLYRSHFTAPDLPYEPSNFEYFSAVGFPAEGVIYVNGFGMLGLGKNNLARDGYGRPTPGLDVVVAAGLVQGSVFNWSGHPVTGGYEAWMGWRITYYVLLDGAGKVYSWGTPTLDVADKGVLGVGDVAAHLIPTAVDMTNMPILPNVCKVASNGKTTLFLTSTGDVYGCGDNSQGMALANGATDSAAHSTPVLILDHTTPFHWPVLDITIGEDCAAWLEGNGDIYMWGPNTHGSLGRGNTTAQLFPIRRAGGFLMAAGRDYFVYATSQVSSTFSIWVAGGNTFGQLGRGTSGADVTTFANMLTTNFPNSGVVPGAKSPPTVIAAGDAQTIVAVADANLSVLSVGLMVCGRAEFGSLSFNAFSVGTGVNKIVSTPINVVGANNMPHRPVAISQCGPVTIFNTTQDEVITNGGYSWGDGAPHGGTDDDGFGGHIYGQASGTRFFPVINASIQAFGSDYTSPIPNPPNLVAILSSSGSQNTWTVGDSRVAMGGVTSDGLLYTWGWGGAGQMGNGAVSTSNLVARSLNGLTEIMGGAVAVGIMFAISRVDAVITVHRGRSFGSVV